MQQPYKATTTLPSERDGKTLMNMHLLYQTSADRDGHVGSGMEYGMNVTYDRLDDYLQTLKQAA